MVRHQMKILACGALLLASQAFAAQGGDVYKARLSVVPLDVAMQANVAGLGQVTATLNGNRLTVTGDAKRKMLEGAIEDGQSSKLPIGRVLAEAEQPIDIHWCP